MKKRLLVEEIEVIPIRIPMVSPYHIATGSYAAVEHVIVKMHTDSGLVGYGEAAPKVAFCEETWQSARDAILHYLGPAVKGENALEMGRLHDRMDQAMKKNHFAKTAIDMAAYDVMGKYYGVPVGFLIGGMHRRKVAVRQSIGMDTPRIMAEKAKYFVEQRGFQSLKLKLGIDPPHDIERIAAVREAIGSQIELSVDVNTGYSKCEAGSLLKRMDEYHLTMIEQPVKEWDLKTMAELRHGLKTPLMADESVTDWHDVIPIIREGAADVINIKIQKVGGIFPSLKAAALAEGAGLSVCVGGMMETGLGTMACAHFAASLPEEDFAGDFRGPELLTDDIINPPLRISGSCIEVPDGPGLGVEVDEEKLKKYKVQ